MMRIRGRFSYAYFGVAAGEMWRECRFYAGLWGVDIELIWRDGGRRS